MSNVLRRALLLAALVPAGTPVAGGCNRKTDPRPAEPAAPAAETTAPAPDPAAPPEFTLSPAEFVAEVKRDRKAGEQKYAGKVVEVAGKVGFVGEYSEGKRTRTLGVVGDDPGGDSFYCDVVAPERAPGRFALGQSIRLRGVVGTKPVFPRLTRGEVLDLGPPQLVKVTAEELGTGCAAGAPAADAKYRGRTLLLTGTVAGRPPARFDAQRKTVALKSAPGVTVVCDTNFKLDPLAEKLKAGDAVTMTGIVSSFNQSEKRVELYQFEVVAK